VSWAPASGATSYNVYSSSASPVTKAAAKTGVATTSATLAAANGNPIYVAVAGVNAGGESALSNETCAVPTTASKVGVALYDPLCSTTLDGSKWLSPLFDQRVANGAMVLRTEATGMESNTSRGLFYSTFVPVNDNGQRVTTLQANITVPAASASRSGGAATRAGIRLAYQPLVARLNFPGSARDFISFQVGLRDEGTGLRAFREVTHCDNPSCTSSSLSGISFVDPAGFSGEAPASYDTTYAVSAALDEGTGVLSWSITGGSVNVSGTADPTAYLAGNTNWAALGANPLATSSGFRDAAARTLVLDHAAGSSWGITARFDDVKVGFNNAAPALWDDFSGVGGNSGPIELSSAKWTLHPGMASMALTAGSLVGHAQATTPSTDSLSVFNALAFSDPASINTVQADFTVSACSNSLAGTNRVGVAGALYNDGTPGTTAPDINQPNSRVGDITASLFIDCTAGDVRLQITRFDTNETQTILSNSANALVPKGAASVVGNTHTLRMTWDPVARLVSFQADGQAPVVVDPKTVNARMNTAAPFVKAPNVPGKNLSWFLFFPSSVSTGATASVDFKANNVFTAP